MMAGVAAGLTEEAPAPRGAGQALRALPPVVTALAAFVAVRLVVLLTLALVARERGRSLDTVLAKWDAQWYRGIAENGYGFTKVHEDGRLLADYAFFPLYPSLERVVSATTGLGANRAGLLVSAVASVAAAWGIFAVADHLYGHRVGVLATVLWAALPVGVVESMAYTESLFTALAAWSLHAVLTGRWVVAGALACLAGLTRPTGAAVVAAVVVSAALHHRRAPRPGWRPLLAALVAPLGLVGYLAWVGHQVGRPAGYFDVVSGWGNGFDGGADFGQWLAGLLTGPSPVAGVLALVGVAALVGLYAVCVRQHQPVPLLVFAGVLVVLALTTSGYFGSKPRYLVPAFPLLLPPARWLAACRPRVSGPALVALVTVASAYGAVWLLGPGPP